jgi:hypothetical protein
MATLNVPRKVRSSGEIRVKETAIAVMASIRVAQRRREAFITVTETTGKPLDLKHSLINSVSE